MRLLAFALILGTAPSAAWAQDEYRSARIRELEGGVALQRASESAAEEAVLNLPFLPGDRVWTDGGGRVEFQFDDGTLLRLDSRSKLHYLSHDGRDGRAVLRLWSGSAWLVVRDRAESYEIETSSALVIPRQGGTYRIDADSEETRLSVFDGEASFESGRRTVDVQAGERSWAAHGSTPEEPRRFDRTDSDDFQAWNEDRDDGSAWAGSTPSYVPDEVRPYAGELEQSGSWYFMADVGHVWRPYVASGWRPYWSGRWVWTYYGWTWVPTESWGWAVHHYGRWDHGAGVGWYWIPGSTWGPAWVSWAVGGDYVGWCPLGRRDRPVTLGHAAPRGSLAAHAGTSAWVYTRRTDLAAAPTARRRVDLKPEQTSGLRVAETPQARPSRDLRTIEVRSAVQRDGAVPRNVRMRQTPGDTVPEIAVDNRTTIPAPVVRRSRPRDDEPDDRHATRETPGTATRRDPAGSGRTDAAEVSTPSRSRSRQEETNPARPSWSRERDRSHDGEPSPRSGEASPRERVSDRRDAERRDAGRVDSRDDGYRSATPRGRDTDSDRDVLRRMFRPLSERPAPEGSSSSSSRSEPRAEPRSEPRSEPRAEPRREPSAAARHAAPRPSKDKDNR